MSDVSDIMFVYAGLGQISKIFVFPCVLVL